MIQQAGEAGGQLVRRGANIERGILLPWDGKSQYRFVSALSLNL